MNDAVMARLAGAERLLVATDFDGVLAPIIDDPAAVKARPDSMAALRRLAALTDTVVAVVSGRDYDLLARLVAPADNFALVGSHGAQLDWPTGPTGSLDARPERGAAQGGSDGAPADLEAVIADLQRLADRFPGFHVETKPVSVAAHFRRVVDRRAEAVEAVGRLAAEWPAKIVAGKEVVEFTLGRVTKGDAVLALIERNDITTTVYFGDDATDEDVFAVLEADDIGVKVGDGPTVAAHRVGSPEDVSRVLTRLAEARAADRQGH